MKGVSEHNLKKVDAALPLNRLVCVTGVSGSGKSTLVQDVLHPALLKPLGRPTETPGAFAGLEGLEHVNDVVFVDQTPIGRTTRSNPASYVGAFDAIRELFAKAPESKTRGYTTGAVTKTILRRLPDYFNYICPQFAQTDINFQRVPTVDTSNPFVAQESSQ